jgi:ATP-dependent DNA helicase RecG
VNVEEVPHPAGHVFVFHIPSRPAGTAYHYEGAYLMRSGESLVPMTEDQLRRIFEEGKPDWLSQSAREGCSAADVISLLNTQTYFDLMELQYPARREAVLEKFASEKLIEKKDGAWTIANLGAILFAKNLQEFEGVRRKAVRIVTYIGSGKLHTRFDEFIPGGYATEFATLIPFIESQTETNEVIEQALRRDLKMYPQIAIRELVANALIHQDFNETGTSVAIEIFSDRMEISNPGKPLVSTDRFIDEYQSRNERLADLMRRMHICEERGSGVDKTVSAVEAFQLPAPDFRVGERRTTAVLFAHTELKNMDRPARVRACYQHCCLRYVMNQTMTNQSLRERFQLPETKTATVSQIIADAMADGKIKLDDDCTASRRYARYVPYWG